MFKQIRVGYIDFCNVPTKIIMLNLYLTTIFFVYNQFHRRTVLNVTKIVLAVFDSEENVGKEGNSS